jgi:hypothetical protein
LPSWRGFAKCCNGATTDGDGDVDKAKAWSQLPKRGARREAWGVKKEKKTTKGKEDKAREEKESENYSTSRR